MEDKKISDLDFLFNANKHDINRLLENYTIIAKSFLNFKSDITSLIEKLHNFANQYKGFFNELAAISQNPKKLDFYFGKYATEIHKRLQSAGFFLSLTNFSIGETEELLGCFVDNDLKNVTQFLCRRLKKKSVIKEIESDWKSNTTFEPRIKFLSRGLKAHYAGDYIASIPVLIPHIEGILLDFYVKHGLFQDLPKKFQGTEALAKLKEITINEILLETDRINFRRFVNKSKFYEFTENVDALNRGKILHGTSMNYDREDWSSKIIYLIDFLNILTQKNWITKKAEKEKIHFQPTKHKV